MARATSYGIDNAWYNLGFSLRAEPKDINGYKSQTSMQYVIYSEALQSWGGGSEMIAVYISTQQLGGLGACSLRILDAVEPHLRSKIATRKFFFSFICSSSRNSSLGMRLQTCKL